MKRLFYRLFAIVVLAVLLAGSAIVLLREIPSGTYNLASDDTIQSNITPKEWAHVENLLPVMHLYGSQGATGPTILLIPLIQKGIPLQWGWPLMNYDASDRHAIEISFSVPYPSPVAMRPMSDAEAVQMRQTWEAEHERLTEELAAIAQADFTPAWRTALFGGVFSLSIPDGYVLRSIPSNTAYPGVRMVPRGRAIDGDTYLEFVGSRNSTDEEAMNSAEANFRLDTDAFQAGPKAMITRSPEHMYRAFASYRFGDVRIIARGRTSDMESAKDFVGVLNALEAGDAPLELLSGDFIPPSEPNSTDAARAWAGDMADLLSFQLRPENLLTQHNFAQPHNVFLPAVEGRGDSRGYSTSVVAGLLPRGNRFPETDFTVKAEAEDRALRVSLDEENATCIVEFVLPVGAYSEEEDLVLLTTAQFSSLPDCQEVARQFAQMDLDDLRQLRQHPAVARANALAPHAGKYSDVISIDDDVIIVSDGMQSGLIGTDGKVLLMIEATIIRPLAGKWKFQRNGHYGIVDTDERVILPAEYDEISIVSTYGIDEDAGHLQVRKDDKSGIFDIARERFVLPPSFDEVAPFSLWDIFRARNGDTFRLISMTGEEVLPQVFTEYIIGEPARATANDRDFIVLKTTGGSWIFHTRVSHPLLEGEFSDVRLENRSASRLFHLTRPDGTTLTIDSFLEPVEEQDD